MDTTSRETRAAVDSSSGLVGMLECDRSCSDIHGLDSEKVLQLFREFGYACEPFGQLRGISGSLHDFDFVCVNHETGEKMVLQSLLHLDREEDLDVEVVKLRLSTYDSSPDACLVVAAKFSERVRDLASLYKLTVIDTSSGESPYDQIHALLQLQTHN